MNRSKPPNLGDDEVKGLIFGISLLLTGEILRQRRTRVNRQNRFFSGLGRSSVSGQHSSCGNLGVPQFPRGRVDYGYAQLALREAEGRLSVRGGLSNVGEFLLAQSQQLQTSRGRFSKNQLFLKVNCVLFQMARNEPGDSSHG